MDKYLIHIDLAYALCVFLNDGVEIEDRNMILVAEINGPREITTKVISEREMESAKYKDHTLLNP